jgi:uncharacterized protein YjbJ (UPF0337 family)
VEAAMNKDELKGKAEQLKDRAKEAIGEGAKQAGSFIERVKGTVRDKLGKGKREGSSEDRSASREEEDDE